MEDSLILAVSKSDLQASLSLLASGACTNITTPSGRPLLHLALDLEKESQALAMVQLLLINGANPNSKDKRGRSALKLAKKRGMAEVAKLLVGFGADGQVAVEDVVVTFHKYIFEEEEDDKNVGQTAVKGGLHFLEQVASIFQEDLEGLKSDNLVPDLAGDPEIGSMLAELDRVGFRTPSRVRQRSPCTLDRTGASFTCSTLMRDTKNPSMDISKASTIPHVEEKKDLSVEGRCNKLVVGGSPARSRNKLGTGRKRERGQRENIEVNKKLFLSTMDCVSRSKVEPVIDTNSFHSCKSDLERSITMLASSSLLSVCQEFIVSDKSHGVSVMEKRLPSILGVALQDQSLLEQLQTEAENVVGERSSLTLSHMDSMNSMDLREGLAQYGEAVSGPITATTRNAYLRRLKKLRLGLVVPAAMFDNQYPAPMAGSLKNISSITKYWVKLSTMEQVMGAQFNNIPTDVADQVNCLTRETVCKASFNYLLLDPRKTQNLPMRVFSSSDQELWRTFIAAVFYIGKGSRSRPFQHLYEAIKLLKTDSKKKKVSEKIKIIHNIWEADKGVVVVQVFQNTIAVEAFTREAAMIDAIGCDNISNVKGGDYYGVAAGWSLEEKLKLGTFLVFKAFKIFLQEGERQIRPVDLRS